MMLGLRFVESGGFDMAISRLVQNSQSAMVIQALETAQVFHIWTEEQWGDIDAVLKDWDLVSPFSDVVRGERAFVANIASPLLRQTTTQNLKALDEVGIRFAGIPEWARQATWPLGLHFPCNFLTSSFSRSLMIKQWSAYIEFSNQMIEVAEGHLRNRQSVSWRLVEKELENPDEIKHGYLAALWTPNPKLLEKSFIAQSWIRTARIAIALERFRIKEGRYPDELGEIEELNPDLKLSDAWSGDTMLYERVGSDGFLLRMEDEVAAKKLDSNSPYHWRVLSEIPSIPVYKESSKTGNATGNGGGPAMSVEMMKRYGLIPMNPPSNVPVENQQTSLNYRYITKAILVGGEPSGADAFAVLKRQGIKTIVSVDGATPNVELARQYGMQYVHIPIGYDGIDSKAALSLVRVAREFKRPIYVHCHHGQHRGPAAAALLCIAHDALTNEAAQIFMRQAGTSQDYAGLWRDVAQFRPPSDDVDLPELVEVAPVGDMASTMAKMDRAFDRLKSSKEIDWSIPEGDPDLVPTQLALIMREWFHELGRQPLAGQYEGMETGLQRAEDLVAELEVALTGDEVDTASDAFTRLSQACADCHSSYRNE
ncbi:hypothetical protein OAM01_01540 [bacterium]|nr:hypothetical protein [bacterium]